MDTRPLLALVRVIAAAVVLVALGSDIASQSDHGRHELVTTLSYFTVQSNLIGAAVLLLAAARWRHEPTPALDWLRGGAVVYLVVTMVIYLNANSVATVAAYTAGLYVFGLLVIAGVTLSGDWLWARRRSAGPAVVTGVDGA